MNITNIIRFNGTPEIFRSVSQALSILRTTAATSAILVKVNSKEKPKVPGSSSAAKYAQR